MTKSALGHTKVKFDRQTTPFGISFREKIVHRYPDYNIYVAIVNFQCV